MKKFLSIMVCSLLMICPSLIHGATIQDETSKSGNTQSEITVAEGSKVEGRSWGIALGLRSTYFQMTQNTGQFFVGAVNYLHEEQDYLPIKPSVQISLSKYLALEFSYDQFKAGTLNAAFTADGVSYAEHDPRFTDGYIKWEPYTLALQFRWPLFHDAVVPYALGGVSYIKTSWEREDWYYYGFPYPWTYYDWISQGNRPQDYPNGGYRRIYDVEDHTFGTVLGLGVDYFIWKHWALNLDLRYSWARVNFTYSLSQDNGTNVSIPQQKSFPLDSWIVGLGIKYFF